MAAAKRLSHPGSRRRPVPPQHQSPERSSPLKRAPSRGPSSTLEPSKVISTTRTLPLPRTHLLPIPLSSFTLVMLSVLTTVSLALVLSSSATSTSLSLPTLATPPRPASPTSCHPKQPLASSTSTKTALTPSSARRPPQSSFSQTRKTRATNKFLNKLPTNCKERLSS